MMGTLPNDWKGVAEWLASLGSKQEDGGSNPGGAENNRIFK